jgi:hypothetical protein
LGPKVNVTLRQGLDLILFKSFKQRASAIAGGRLACIGQSGAVRRRDAFSTPGKI